jgi:hypothetical protein
MKLIQEEYSVTGAGASLSFPGPVTEFSSMAGLHCSRFPVKFFGYIKDPQKMKKKFSHSFRTL